MCACVREERKSEKEREREREEEAAGEGWETGKEGGREGREGGREEGKEKERERVCGCGDHAIVAEHATLQQTAADCKRVQESARDLPSLRDHAIVPKNVKGVIPQLSLLHILLQCVAVCCSVLQCVAVCCSVLQFSVLQ